MYTRLKIILIMFYARSRKVMDPLAWYAPRIPFLLPHKFYVPNQVQIEVVGIQFIFLDDLCYN